MDCYELKELLAESVRNLARTMDQVRLRELEKCVGKDEPMQDHLSICVETAFRPYEGSTVEECCDYLLKLYNGLEEVVQHDRLMHQHYKYTDYESALVADMVAGNIKHGFPNDLIYCAMEIKAYADKLVPPNGKHSKTKAEYEKIAKNFWEECEKIIEKYNLRKWEKGSYSLPLGYLEAWLERRYWKD